VGDSCVVPRRVVLHRRDLQERRKDDSLWGASLDDPSGLLNSSRNRTANGCENEKSAIGSQCHSDPFQDETWGFGGSIAPVLKPGSPDKRGEI